MAAEGSMEEVLKQILNVQMQMVAAQVAQIGLLQQIATNLALQVEGDAGPEAVSGVNLKNALKGLEAASFYLARR
jgi:hypothetical protein